MSYIRTKDGRIIDTTKYPEHPASWSVQASDYALTIAQSDTIEELCDEFVDDTYKDFYKIKKENGKTFVWSIKQRFKYWNSIDFDFVGTIYGAIYTSKGLIYVAKMNAKGELELI